MASHEQPSPKSELEAVKNRFNSFVETHIGTPSESHDEAKSEWSLFTASPIDSVEFRSYPAEDDETLYDYSNSISFKASTLGEIATIRYVNYVGKEWGEDDCFTVYGGDGGYMTKITPEAMEGILEKLQAAEYSGALTPLDQSSAT